MVDRILSSEGTRAQAQAAPSEGQGRRGGAGVKSAAKPRTASTAELALALRDLQNTITSLPDQYSHVVHPGRTLMFTYVKGIVYGLGALTAFAIIIPLVVSLLQRVEWVPLIGNFVHDVAVRMEQAPR